MPIEGAIHLRSHSIPLRWWWISTVTIKVIELRQFDTKTLDCITEMRSPMKLVIYRDFFLSTDDDFLKHKFMSNHERAIRALMASQSTFGKIKWCMHHFIFELSYCYLYLILHKFCSVLTCDILGIGLLSWL